MSFDFRTVRQPSKDPVLKYITSLQKALQKFITKNEVEKLESSEDIFGNVTDTDTAIKFQTDLNSTHQTDHNHNYYACQEPGNLALLWLKGYNIGTTIKDFSKYGSDRLSELFGEPILVDGSPFDYGIDNLSVGVKSRAVRFNRPTSPSLAAEYIQVNGTYNTALDVATGTLGKSYFIRFRIYDLSLFGGISRTLFEKTDDITPNNGIQLCVTTDGRLRIFIKRAGTEYKWMTNASVINTNDIYDCFITYTYSGNVVHIYLAKKNGTTGVDDVSPTDMTLNANVETINWHPTLTNLDLNVMRRGVGTDGGRVYGDFYDMKVYNQVITSTQVGRHWINKLTVSDIPFGQVIAANHWAPSGTTGVQAYTTTGFTSTSFTT